MTPILNESDIRSPTWQKLARHYEEKLQRLRKMNDGDHDELKTSKLRGEIKAIVNLLQLGVENQAPAEEVESID